MKKIYQKNENVDVIWIDFVNLDIGKLQRNKYHQLYDKYISPNWTPILCIAKQLASNSKSSQTIVQMQFPIQLACARPIHRSQGLTLVGLAFEPSHISTHVLVYTTLSRVKTMESLYLVNKLTQKNFHVNKKIVEEMRHLTTNALWKLGYIQTPITNTNTLSVATLNTRSLYAHINDIVHDKDLMNIIILYIQ